MTRPTSTGAGRQAGAVQLADVRLDLLQGSLKERAPFLAGPLPQRPGIQQGHQDSHAGQRHAGEPEDQRRERPIRSRSTVSPQMTIATAASKTRAPNQRRRNVRSKAILGN